MTAPQPEAYRMRDLPFPHLDFDRVREYANERVNGSSLRVLAYQIGINHSTLHNFIEGARPHARTRAALGAWYVEQTGDEGRPGAVETRGEAGLRAALTLLGAFYPPEYRASTRRRFAAFLVKEAGQSGVPVPAWLRDEAADAD